MAFGAMPTGSAPPAFPSHARWLAVVVLSSLLLYGGLAGDGRSTGAPLNKLGCSLIRRKAIFASSTQAVTMAVEIERGEVKREIPEIGKELIHDGDYGEATAPVEAFGQRQLAADLLSLAVGSSGRRAACRSIGVWRSTPAPFLPPGLVP